MTRPGVGVSLDSFVQLIVGALRFINFVRIEKYTIEKPPLSKRCLEALVDGVSKGDLKRLQRPVECRRHCGVPGVLFAG